MTDTDREDDETSETQDADATEDDDDTPRLGIERTTDIVDELGSPDSTSDNLFNRDTEDDQETTTDEHEGDGRAGTSVGHEDESEEPTAATERVKNNDNAGGSVETDRTVDPGHETETTAGESEDSVSEPAATRAEPATVEDELGSGLNVQDNEGKSTAADHDPTISPEKTREPGDHDQKHNNGEQNTGTDTDSGTETTDHGGETETTASSDRRSAGTDEESLLDLTPEEPEQASANDSSLTADLELNVDVGDSDSGGDGDDEHPETADDTLSYESDESLPSLDLSLSDRPSTEDVSPDTPVDTPEAEATPDKQTDVLNELMTETAPQLLVVDNTGEEDNPFRIQYGLPRAPRRLFVISSSSEVMRQLQSSQYDVAQTLEAVKILKMGSSGRGDPGRRETTFGTGLSIDVHQTSRQDDLSRVGILATQLLSDWDNIGAGTAAQINAIDYLLDRFETETVFDFLYTLTRMINSRGVTGLYYIDPGETNLETFQTIRSLFDGVITYTGDGFETGMQYD